MLLARAYSHHSLLSALPKVEALVKDAKQKGYTTIALTDEETGAGFVEFYDLSRSEQVKPALGTTLNILNVLDKDKSFSKIAVLAKNKQGYLKLLELITIARTQREKPKYHVLLADLKENVEHLFIVLPTNEHELGTFLRKHDWKSTQQVLKIYTEELGASNLLVEAVYPLYREQENEVVNWNLKLLDILSQQQVRLIVSPAPRYLEPEDAESFRVILAIKKQTKLFDITLERDFSLPSVTQLKEKFAYLPETVLDTSAIEAQIDIQIRTDYDKHADEAFFPPFNLPPGQNAKDRLAWETYIGLVSTFAQENFTFDPKEESLRESILQKISLQNLKKHLD